MSSISASAGKDFSAAKNNAISSSSEEETACHSATIYASEDDPLQISGYRVNRAKQALTWALIFATVGLLRLIFFWKPEWMLYATHSKCSLEGADTALLVDKYDQSFVEEIRVQKGGGKGGDGDGHLLYPTANGLFKTVPHRRHLENRKTKYVWNSEERRFEKLVGLDFNYLQCGELCAQGRVESALSEDQVRQRRALFGANLIEIAIEPLAKVFFTEVLNPFYIYQFCAVGFWMADAYYYYASYILFMSVLSLALTTYQIRVNQRRLRDKVTGSSQVLVCRRRQKESGVVEERRINSSDLVPGDVVILEGSCQLYFDSVLLSGEVIVNEAMLTGESSPVTKTPLRDSKDQLYDHRRDGRHILFCGTAVVQVRQLGATERPRAIVVRTNFETAKGELVKSILFPKPIDFKFSRHINHFLLAMAVIAMIGFTYTVVLKIIRHADFSEIVYKAVDLVTIVVPPELPAALTIATIFVDKRLRNRQIFCMSPRAINISGCVDAVCFDKTGTLTEDAIDLHEIVQVKEEEGDNNEASFEAPIKEVGSLSLDSPWARCLASTHSLKVLLTSGEEIDNGDNVDKQKQQLIGEDLELKLFHWTGWSLEEPEAGSEARYGGYTVPTVVSSPDGRRKVGVLKQFPFTSKAARMSVIVRSFETPQTTQEEKEETVEFFIKGAPEMIVKMCQPETVPANFAAKLEEYTRKSYRVLAIATRKLEGGHLSPAQLEANSMEVYEQGQGLHFLGLVVLRNKLKVSTAATIAALNEARIRSIMVTGDNLMTALSVARECSITVPGEEVIILEASSTTELGSGGGDQRPVLRTRRYESDSSGGDGEEVEEVNKILSQVSLGMEPNERYQLAMTGQTFKVLRENYPELLSSVMVRGAVYARMAPDQKQQLVEQLQTVGYYVAMCGDGANDCGALKVAHAGVSLSDTEASVASAFTSLTGEISCVVDLLREGRASLVSVFGIVRYMACYNITTFLAICILYWYHSALTDIQNLYQDIAIISVYIFLFGRTFPYDKLSPIRPPTSLIGISQFSSILLQLALVAVFQFATVWMLHSQPWYVAKNGTENEAETDNDDYVCHDNYALFIIQVFQYVTLVIIFSKGAPYRRPFYKNRYLTAAIVLTTAITLALVLSPENPWPGVAKFFGLAYEGFPLSFRGQIIALNVAHFVVAILAEKFIVEQFISKLTRRYKTQPYERIYSETVGLRWLPQFPQNAAAAR